MTARAPKSPLLWWERQALDEAVAKATRSFPLETGGVLLGWRTGPRLAVVSHVVGPGPGAEHHERSFRPDAAWQQKQINEIYENSGRRVTYLGDWHTHPKGSPSLSRRDANTLRRIARYGDARAPKPIMAVLGGGDPDWLLGARQVTSAWAPRLQSMQIHPYDA